ncbi:DUF1697 domain-containing protein [Wukongibacter baidiensis]|uniref:DUF1697 domain-containing protein n=1 Tax=Wukongibacter baidiensis TaxID=1723361 RepID=UPI003D7F51E5
MMYCAFFRGINLNGVKMTMTTIKERFEKIGFRNIVTVLATGNVIFSAGNDMDESAIVKRIVDDLSSYYNREVYIFLKTKEDIMDVIDHSMSYDSNTFHLYWMLVDKTSIRNTIYNEFDETTAMEGEQVTINGEELYWLVPKGFTLHTPFSKVLGKKKYKEHLTSRNLNTIKKILTKMQ